MRDPKILIVGAGIGGLAFALALQRNGFEATVWERASEIREIGAGLLLTSNAAWVLEKLGLGEDARKAGRVVSQWQILNRRAQTLQTFHQKDGNSISISRSAFQRLLLDHLPPGNVILDREVVSIVHGSGNEVARGITAKGESNEANLIVGADGGRSIIRKSVCALEPRILGYIGWRGLVEAVPAGWECGRITESWGSGGRFGIARVSDGWTYWYATENAQFSQPIPPGERKAHLLARFRGWHSPVRDLIDATSEEAILLNDISEQRALKTWSKGCVTLLGDAAHLLTPNLGQSAAMALEDAWVLARCLKENPVREAIARYEDHRKRRASYVVWQSRQVGHLIQLQNPVLTVIRDIGLQLLPDSLGALALKPVFGFRA